MARTARYREATRKSTSGGSFKCAPGSGSAKTPDTQPPIRTHYASCTDAVGRPVVDSPLEIISCDVTGLHALSGRADYGPDFWCQYSDVFPDSLIGSSLVHSQLPTHPMSDNQVAVNVLARTNPSRPSVVPLTLLQDLYDIPRMLKSAGHFLMNPRLAVRPKGLASNYLGTLFGWIPLIQDVKNLLNLQELIHKRTEELAGLYKNGGTRRRISLGERTSDEDVREIPVTLIGNLWTSWAKGSRSTRERSWATVRWKPITVPGYRPTDKQLIQLASKVVSGLTPEGAMKGAWDLIPWTWIINWFTDVASYALTFSNSVPATSSNVCRMTDTRTLTTWVVSAHWPGVTGGDGSAVYQTKVRSVCTSSPSVTIPFLSGMQLSILGALAIQRFRA